jgi:thiamine pyrophosphate-dependent acetolactate synthase large subunit-like protein
MRQLGEQVRNKSLGLNIDDPVIDFSSIARAMGINGRRVSGPGELKENLKTIMESDGPELLEVPVEGRI